MKVSKVGVLGVTSLIGQCLIQQLKQSKIRVVAFTRQSQPQTECNIKWKQLNFEIPDKKTERIFNWIITAPIWVLPAYFEMLETYGAKRLVVLSSTSLFTKIKSTNNAEQSAVSKLVGGESQVKKWAEERDIEWIVLRPTLIYGLGRDKNVSEIARFVQRWRFFPIVGKGDGLRQPIHAEDVAKACVSALSANAVKNQAFNLSGGEVLTYREIVLRIFNALGKHPRIVSLPRWCFRLAFLGLCVLPRFRHLSIEMADRMSSDMDFDHSDAAKAFEFSSQPFILGSRDLP